jgi:hypothetical protein
MLKTVISILSSFDSVYIESGKPYLTYNSDSEQFNLAVILKRS